MAGTVANPEPTFDLPSGSSSDFYLSREVNKNDDPNHGKIVKRHKLWKYPFLTRRTGDSLVGTNEEITSNELRHGRTASKTKIGNESSSGTHDFEYSPETFDDQMEGVFRSEWVRFFHDGQENLITKDFLTPNGYIHVNGDEGTYNQEADGKRVNSVPLFYTDADDKYGLIKVKPEQYGYISRAAAVSAGKPFGKYVAHELHIGEKPVKYSFMSRIPINDSTVRYQNYKHVEVGQMDLNVTVNSIVTGSFQLMGSNNPSYYTENLEKGKTRMAVKMYEDKDVAISGNGTSVEDELYSVDYRKGAEKFLATVKDTIKSTETDQFTALEGFLFVNGHQLQYASDLTMTINNNLQAINAIFVKGAIANLAPKLDITGNLTVYFTDGEIDDTGKKYGADDLKNLASKNTDVEIVYAFQDKEEPETIYLFQIFKSTFTSPSETKDAENPISLELTYNSYGETAVRCIKLEIPKIRDIEFDSDTVATAIKAGDTVNSINLTLYPNTPLDSVEEASYVDSTSDNFVFNNAEIKLNSEDIFDYSVSDVTINEDGFITATLSLEQDLNIGDSLQVILNVNGETCDKTVSIEPSLDYIVLKDSVNPIEVNSSFNIISSDILLFDKEVTADDIKITVKSDADITVTGTSIVIGDDVATGSTATITVESAYNSSVKATFDIKVKKAGQAETPTVDLDETKETEVDTAITLTATASVTDGGTLSYQWYKDDELIEGATSLSYEIDADSTEDSGVYKIVVTNTNFDTTASAEASCVVTVTE